jgi:PhnB protein
MASRRKSKPTRKPAKPTRKAAKKTARRKSLAKPRKADPIPKGIHTVAASLCFQDAAFAMLFYEKAFGAKELYRLSEPGGRIGHAEMRIGDSVVMLSDEYPDMAILSAKTLNGSPIRLHLSVKNPDACMERAIHAGATLVRPMQDEFYGWRSGVVTDPFGYSWFIASQIEVVSPKEMQTRWDKMMAASKSEGSLSKRRSSTE